MSATLVGIVIVAYFSLLIIISRITSRKADNESFFNGNRKSPWYVIAFGMIGTSLSGVTFISVPGWVGNSQFHYYQLVLGYFIGYLVVANVLLPLYYKSNLTSIYTYLETRFGKKSYKTGASFFLLSRTIGASFRLFIVANVLQITFFNHFGVPFWATTIATICLIWVYTHKGGIKTIIWTDTLQTLFLLIAVGVTIFIVSKELNLDDVSLTQKLYNSDYTNVFNWDWNSSSHFIKYIFSGAFITIVMTGLDQDMMQKNLSCRNLKDAKKNMYWYGGSFLATNFFFLVLGAMLYMYVDQIGLDFFANSDFTYDAEKGRYLNTDDLYPFLATNNFGVLAGITFLLGIIAAAFSSADSALAALTTSFTIDIVGIEGKSENEVKKLRKKSHILFSFTLAAVILIFHIVNNDAVIDAIFTAAGYTYGPLLGMYAYGLITKRGIKDKYMPIIAIISPIFCYILAYVAQEYWSYNFGYEILMLNGLLTFIGMQLISHKTE